MKYFVKFISIILLAVLTLVDIGWIAEFCICIFNLIADMYTPVGELYITSSIGNIIIIIIFAVLVLLLIAEIAAKIILYIKSVKKSSYGFYMIFSGVSIAESIINVIVIAALGFPLIVNCPPYEVDNQRITTWFLVLVGTYLFTGFFAVLNLLSANQCRKDELF